MVVYIYSILLLLAAESQAQAEKKNNIVASTANSQNDNCF
jgi:hypothetical protein